MNKSQIEQSIDVLEHPKDHIRVEKDGSLSYSADMVLAFETAINVLNEKLDQM